MFYNVKNENIKYDGTDCDLISFGTGDANCFKYSFARRSHR